MEYPSWCFQKVLPLLLQEADENGSDGLDIDEFRAAFGQILGKGKNDQQVQVYVHVQLCTLYVQLCLLIEKILLQGCWSRCGRCGSHRTNIMLSLARFGSKLLKPCSSSFIPRLHQKRS